MRSIFLSCILIFTIVSCETSELDDLDQTPSESLIDQRFQKCYYEDDMAKNQADSVLISLFGAEIFVRNIQLDLKESTMNCQVDSVIQRVPFGDQTHCVPNSYDLQYQIKDDGESIFPFRMLAGKDMVFEPVSLIVQDQLYGYRKLINGELKINYSQASEIAKNNGVDLEKSTLELVKNEANPERKDSSYHWEAELEFDHGSFVVLHIDAQSGKTSKEVFTVAAGPPIN